MAGANRDQNLAALKRRLIIKRIKTALIYLTLFTSFSLSVWYVREGEFFKFRGLEVSGAKRVPEEEVKKYFTEKKNDLLLAKILRDDNALLWLSVNGDDLPALYPRLANASLSRDIFNRTVKVSVEEKAEKYIWCSESAEEKSCYWLDDSGEVFASAPDAEGELVRVIIDRSTRPVEVGSRPLNAAEMVNLKKILSLSDKRSWSIASAYLKSAELNDFFIVLKTGQEIYFSLDVDPSYGDSVISALYESGEWASLEYLDLRIAGKGFYKLK